MSYYTGGSEWSMIDKLVQLYMSVACDITDIVNDTRQEK